jgi:hypothetical protein
MDKTKNIIIIFLIVLLAGGFLTMSRGHKDFGQSGQTAIIHSVTDMGELAARLGSPNVFQRSGNVIFMTDFEHGLADLVQDPQGEGSSIDLMGDRAYSGGSSVRLIGGEDGGMRAILTKRFHTVETNQMGIESTFSMNADCEYFSVSITVRDGDNKKVYQLHANMTDGEFQYYNSGGTKTFLHAFDWGNDDLDHWHTMKLIVDLENKKYVRAFYNEEVFDLTDIEPHNTPTGDAPRLDFGIWTLAKPGKNGIAYADNFIITINEP